MLKCERKKKINSAPFLGKYQVPLCSYLRSIKNGHRIEKAVLFSLEEVDKILGLTWNKPADFSSALTIVFFLSFTITMAGISQPQAVGWDGKGPWTG